jgi:endonuclease/exonuclease/phosphatase family metal-dependent hydrolase
MMLRVVSQNILHGLACAPDTARCELADRVALFTQQLDDSGCPEVVAVQEADADIVTLFETHLDACGYDVVWDGDDGLDRELVLTTLGLVDSRRIRLAGGVRTAYAMRFDSAIGVVDLVTTHLAASTDNGRCDATTCPPPCDPSGRLRDCQAQQVLAVVDELATSEIVVLAGDLNTTPDEPIHQLIVDAGFVDSHLAGGRPECAPNTPASCTAGRDDTSLADMTNPDSRQTERIDYVFAQLPDRCEIGGDTGSFNADPSPGAIAYPSDHTGVVMDLTCPPSESRSPTTFPPAPTTTLGSLPAPPDDETEQAITTAFETLFDGGEPDIEKRLGYLQDADRLRATLMTVQQQAGDLAASTSARVDSIAQTSATTADVVFSVLVGDSVALDHIQGDAVRTDDQWLVSAATFCTLATTVAPDVAGC